MNNSPEGAQGSANSKTPKFSGAFPVLARHCNADEVVVLKSQFDSVSRQLAQSEERVKALTEGLDKLTAWGLYCPDWADPKSKDEYAKDFMAALALLSSSKKN